MVEHSGNRKARMLPLYAARIEDLGLGDFLKVDCAACHHVALLTPGGPIEGRAEPCGQGSRPQERGSGGPDGGKGGRSFGLTDRGVVRVVAVLTRKRGPHSANGPVLMMILVGISGASGV
jgi:hypothetical protein